MNMWIYMPEQDFKCLPMVVEPIALRWGLLLNKKLADWAMLPGQGALWMCLSLPDSAGASVMCSHAKLSVWELGIHTHIFMLQQQTPSPTKPSPLTQKFKKN